MFLFKFSLKLKKTINLYLYIEHEMGTNSQIV